jgi:hypothetical protein
MSCAPFLDWCRVAVASGVGPANPLQHPLPHMVMPDPRLGAQRVEILRADLPERFVVPGANLSVIVTALGHIQADTAMRDDARVTHEETRKAAAFQPYT